MPLTRLDNLISSKTGKYLYVSPDDFNATDALSNRGNSPVTPFKSIQRAFLEIARYSYLPGFQNDRFDQFSIMLMPGIHYIDNRPGLSDTSNIDIFGFDQANNAWTDDSILDLSNPDNIFYKFNNTEGGAIIPRGSSLVGYDLRRTVVRPLYVPDPAVTEREIPRSAMFNVTGGCYFWQFTLKDGQTTSESPLFDAAEGTGKVYYDPTDFTKLAAPNYSHHKLTVFEYADTDELGLYYQKVAKAFSAFQPTIDDPGEFDTRVQENRIVGPLSDSRVIESLKITDATTDPSIPASTSEIEVTTKIDHGYFQGQFVAIDKTEIDDVLEGIFAIKRIDQADSRKFTYEVPFVASAIGSNIVSGQTVSVDTTPALGQNAQTLAEVDSVESASPYVFNVSIRSTWGICGIWANGLKATGFRSMVIAQYTGVSLQKDDRAFIRYDEYTNTWNQASLVDAFATVPYHTKGDAYFKDEWRTFHVRASEDSFIQCVSIFAVGFADHFLMESGGDMSITNSNSNFGNTSLHAIGFKGFAFNQDKGGYLTDIIPPKVVVDNTASTEKINYYTIDIQGTLSTSQNYTKLFLGSDEISDPLTRPAATINGFRIGAKSDDKLYVKLDPAAGTDEFFEASLQPTGFVKYVAKGSILNPSGGVVNSIYADASNLIESNRRMIQEEVFGYILEKYPRLQNIPYVNPGLDPAGNRYFDARNLIQANRQEIVDTAYDDMVRTYGVSNIQGAGNDGKCKRDIGIIVDAISEDLKDGGNANIIAATRSYFELDDDINSATYNQFIFLSNGLEGEEDYATYAFRRARDLCKQAIANLLTVKADLYDPDPNSNLAPYGINIGKTGSQAELDGDTTNGVTIDLALKADPASRYKDARNRIVANREFILDAAVAEIAVYHPDFYHPTDTQTNSQSRLADAFRLIRRNSSEIRDKALAQISVDHPNFYIDGDQQTDEGSRYASAYRLIQKNRDQIVDTALAETTVQHPDYYFVGDQQTDARSRYADGYRLIVQNRTEIVNTAWANMLVSYPNHGQYEAKCKRDLGIFVDAIGLDLFVGGNKYSRTFIQEYFTSAGQWISGGLQGEESQSIEAFNQARDQMKLAVANQLSITDPTVTPGPAQYGGGGGDIPNNQSGACDDVQSAIVTLTDIVTTQVAAGNLNALPAETSYIAGPGEEKCRRDIGIFVDSVALDLFCKGNVYAHRFAAEFFVNETTPEFSFNSAVYNTNFNKAAEMMKKAMTNQLYFKDNGTQGAIDRTADNAPGSAYGQVSKDFTPHGADYDATTGDLVLDIADHGLSVGDRVKIADNSLSFKCSMDGYSSVKTYPRNTDPASTQYLGITASTADSITVNVGASPIVNHQVSNGTYDPVTGLMELTIGAHNLTAGTAIKMPVGAVTFSCNFGGATGAAAEKAYPRQTYVQVAGGAPSGANYNPTTGVMTLTFPTAHGLQNGNVIYVAQGGLTFTCDLDGNTVQKTYPRASDPLGLNTPVFNVTTNSFDIQVLDFPPSSNTSNHTFVSATNTAIMRKRDAAMFDNAINIESVTATTITVKVLENTPSTNTDPHTFVSAIADAVQSGGGYTHRFLSAASNAVNFGGNTENELTDAQPFLCSDVQSATDSLTSIVTTILANGNLSTMPIEVNYGSGRGPGEVKCARDLGYFIDAISVDMYHEGNKHTREYTEQYFTNATTPLPNGLQGEESESITAYNTALNEMKKAITNQLYYKDLTVTEGGSTFAGSQTDVGTPTNVTYDATTGTLVTTIVGHGLANGDKIKFLENSLVLSCTMDGNTSNKSYPRPSDPSFNTWLTVANKTDDTFEVNVGTSPLVNHDVTNATYDATTGLMVLTLAGAHGLTAGTSVRIADNSLSFTCTMDGNTSTKTYPRAGIDPSYQSAVNITNVSGQDVTVDVGTSPLLTKTVTAATYNPTSGDLVLTIGQHTLKQNTNIKLAPESLVFTCTLDGNVSQKAYPRATGANTSSGADYAYDTPLPITSVTGTTITINVNGGQGAISDLSAHTFVSGTNAVISGGDYVHTWVGGTSSNAVTSGGNYAHTFVSATTNAVRKQNSAITSRTSSSACSDVQSAIDSLGTIVTDAIAAGNITGGIWNQPVNPGTLIPGEEKCRRDLGIVVDAVAQDLWFGGNEFSISVTKEYFKGNQLIANGVDNEQAPAITAFKRAEDLMQRALNNQYYDRDLNITLDTIGDPPIVGDIECDAHDMVIANQLFIAKEAYERMKAAYPSYTPSAGNTEQDCLDDIYDVLREVMWDVKFGGNYKTYSVAKGYITNDFNGKTYPQIIQDVERDEVAKVFQEVKNVAMQVIKNEAVTVTSGNNLTQIIDNTIVDDWDEEELLPKCGSAVAAVDTLMGIIIQAIGNDSGVGNLDGIQRTTQDGPDPAWNTALNIISTTQTSITVNVGQTSSQDQDAHTFVAAVGGAVISGGNYDHTFVSANANAVSVVNGGNKTPVNATYNAVTGDMVLYFGQPHYIQTTDQISIAANSLSFTCGMDGNTSTKTYPRTSDPISGQNVNPTAVTTYSITVNVGQSPLVEWNVSNAVYDYATGTLALTIGNHSLPTGTSIRLKEESLIFTCTKDQNKTTHAYPRSAGKYRPSAYQDGNCSDVCATVNALIDILCNTINDGNLDSLPPLSNGEWDCANVRSSIETLFDILNDAINGKTLAGLPPLNTGDFTINNEASKCFRDVTYIVDAIVNDLRVGGNINSIQAGEAYYVGNSLEYIDGEKTETLDAWNYVGEMATAAMRNFDVLAYNCSTTSGSAIVDVNDTRGIIIGMSVKEYDDTDPVNPAYVNGLLQDGSTQLVSNIPAGTYVKRIVSNTQIELGVNGSRLNEGNTVNALQTSTTTELYFVYEKGIWADTLPTTVTVGPESTNPDVIQDTTTSASSRECAGTANAIETLVGNITTIINSGLGTVVRQEQTVNTALLASRATVFTIDVTGAGPSNPHDFETGTPVRLVPRPRFDQTTGRYVDVDKRLVRLPNGFETNRTYYVITPGRRTEPENYGATTFFDGNDQTRLMLATSKENAAAGIYIYASETDAIDKDVEIDLYQFIIDDSYDLHKYKASLTNTVNAGIMTDVAHIFDIPSNSTTAQKAFIRAIEGGVLPLVSTAYANDPQVAVTNSNDANFGRINPKVEFFTRYQNNKVVTLHKTKADAINNVNPITFGAGQTGVVFNLFANKRRSPMQYDPGFASAASPEGKWFINCKDEVTGAQTTPTDNIFWRLNQSDYQDRQRSTDMWYQRLTDNREKDDRTYKLRMVIPKYLENARDPINGFVMKTRTDDTRKLVPQKILLKPVTGTVYGARFENPVNAGEYIGDTTGTYDPYKRDTTGAGIEYRAMAKFVSGVQATIQSGRKVKDILDDSIEYTELTVFDHGIDTQNFPGLRNEIFTTVKITSPQGGIFVTSKVDNTASATNAVSFAGNSSGLANIHAYYTVDGEHYIIIKNIRSGTLEYSEFANTRFTQGTVFADMLEDQDMGKSLPLKTQIAKNNPQFFYKQNGANVYTVTPGDRIQDSAGVEYYVDSVEDVGVIEDTFYVFGYETLQKRISGQQDGIYYLTALRGNISPFPTGAGVTNNFKKFKFSQPVSKLYPLNYRNDPLWFTKSGTSQLEKDYYAGLIDPPSTFSAADNYTHGLVYVNDFKGSTTREMVDDLTEQPAFLTNTYDIKAQTGNATSGSEDRLIPIGGSGDVSISDTRYYVELRRPSIARAGNHTFEYLGYGPGNYSTGLPIRQEIVLTPDEDFYAQSKKQDAGIVFYTGINSQGDLYIGNRRINAITGEETFIDQATLADDGDEDDTIGGLVTTFDTPVTFNQNITVVGGDGQLVSNFESPVVISVQDGDFIQQKDALIIRSNVDSTENDLGQIEQDEGLDRTAFSPPTAGDITLSKNTIKSAVFQFNARGNGQRYLFQTHTIGGIASNITPNQSQLIANGGSRINTNQFTTYAGVLPLPGDVLLKGSEIGKSGSLGWILSNYFSQIPNTQIDNIIFDGTNVVKLEFRDFNTGVAITNQEIGITSGSQIRIKNFYFDPRLNLTWQVYSKPGDTFQTSNNYVHFQVIDQIPQSTSPWETIIAGTAQGAVAPTIEFSNSNFKEVGVIGGEALRTDTETIGDYKLGINTVTRLPHSAYTNAFVGLESDPRANLDVVGTAFISGRTTGDFLQHTNFADRDKTAVDNAFLVGGDSAFPNDQSVFRIATTNSGRVGINVNNTLLDRALVVNGLSRFTDDARFEHDIEVNGDDGVIAEIRTSQTTGTFNLIDDSTFVGTLNLGSEVTTAYLFNDSTADQFIHIGRSSEHSNIWLGVTPDSAGTAISKVEIGGAFANTNEDLSYTKIKTRNLRIDGDAWLGFRKGLGETTSLKSQASQVDFFSNTGGPSIINFATNASEINIAGQGGKTTINNQLEVIASAKFNGDIHMCGGVASFAFTGGRAQLGTDISAHEDGIISTALFNKNIDILNVLVKGTNEEGYNQIDTAGAGQWGGTSYQNTVNTGGSVEPIVLPAISGDEYYIPLKFEPVKANGDPYFGTSDYIIVDSAVVGTGSSATGHPEILQITELTRINEAPYYIKVKRQPFGAFGGVLSNHVDTTPIYKVNVQFDATWTEQALDNDTSATDSVYLSEFGGSLTNNDYVIVDRNDSPKVPEYIKVISPLEQQVQKFRISNCADPDEDVFVVNSVTGEVQIGNPNIPGSVLTVNSSLNMDGGCGTLGTVEFTGDTNAGTNVITNIQVVTAGKTIADLQRGDVVSVVTDSSPLKIFQDTTVDFVFGGAVYLSRTIIGSSSVSGGTFKAQRNERITATDGGNNTTFDVDTCSGTTTIGTHAGRFDLNLAWSSAVGILNNANLPSALNDDNIVTYGYYADPTSIQANGASSTIISTAAGSGSGTLQIAVQQIGEGTGKFTVGDLIAVGPLTSFTSTTGQIEFMTVTDVVDGTNTIVATRAQEGTAEMSHQQSDVVRRVIKHERQSLVVDAQIRQRLAAGVPTDYLSVILERGYISQTKLDYKQWLRFSNTSTGVEILTNVNGRLYGKNHTTQMDEQQGDGAKSYREGSLTVTDNLTLEGGNFVIYDSVKQTKLFQFVNDDGHADHSGLINWDAGVLARGDFFLYPTSCPENVITTLACDPSFSVDNLGNVTALTTLTVTGVPTPTPTEEDVFSVRNLGISGGSEYTIKKDRSIDAFGLQNFTTSNGARHTRYLSAASPEADLTLIANIVYMVNVQNTQTLIVTLPAAPKTGDIVRMIDVGGNLKYDTTLVIRTPETSGTPIQGDAIGTLFGDRITPYPSGELVVQTPNAGFALIYLGAIDSNNQIGIPTSVQGWWLMEV